MSELDQISGEKWPSDAQATNENNESNQDDNECNYWKNTVEKIYSLENHEIPKEILDSILSKIKIW
jgi:hypothetical protein